MLARRPHQILGVETLRGLGSAPSAITAIRFRKRPSSLAVRELYSYAHGAVLLFYTIESRRLSPKTFNLTTSACHTASMNHRFKTG
jgi:hypothetical protein